MAPEDRTKFLERLHQEILTVRESEARSGAERAPVQLDQTSVGRLSRMDAMQQQAMAAAQSRRRAVRLQALQAALRRVEMDEFGWCQRCGEPIAEARLELDPCVTRGVACAAG